MFVIVALFVVVCLFVCCFLASLKSTSTILNNRRVLKIILVTEPEEDEQDEDERKRAGRTIKRMQNTLHRKGGWGWGGPLCQPKKQKTTNQPTTNQSKTKGTKHKVPWSSHQEGPWPCCRQFGRGGICTGRNGAGGGGGGEGGVRPPDRKTSIKSCVLRQQPSTISLQASALQRQPCDDVCGSPPPAWHRSHQVITPHTAADQVTPPHTTADQVITPHTAADQVTPPHTTADNTSHYS